MSHQSSGSNASWLSGVCWAGWTLRCASLGDRRNGLSVTSVWEREFEEGNALLAWGISRLPVEEVAAHVPLFLSNPGVLPSFCATMFHVMWAGKRRGKKVAELSMSDLGRKGM